jgi:hypothetical protein
MGPWYPSHAARQSPLAPLSLRLDVGTRRLYGLDGAGLEAAQGWLADLRGQWGQRLDAIETELARGRRRTQIDSKREEDAA